MLNRRQCRQNRVTTRLYCAAHPPLNVTYPHRHAGEFNGKLIDLDPQQILRPHHPLTRKIRQQPQRIHIERRAILDVFQRVQREIQKVAAATCRVEHAKRTKLFQERVVLCQRIFSRLLRRSRVGGCVARGVAHGCNPVEYFLPFRQQRTPNHRVNDLLNLLRVGVVRSKLRPLRRVESTLEKRTEDARVNV